MNALRLLLISMLLVISAYTASVALDYGLNLFPVFFGAIASLTWPGQFNLDLLFMLVLSGLWVAWRHHFSVAGIGLGLLATVGGIVFLSLYLLIMLPRANGSIKSLLLGPRE